ncbi:hypothetical protein ACKFKF_04995 [Phormidesmis sp. 146-12]
MQTGTLSWLIQQELKLWWRETDKTIKFVMMFLVLVVITLVVGQYFLLIRSEQLAVESTTSSTVFWSTLSACFFAGFYIFTQAINLSMIAISQRGELNLLLSSPLNSQVIFASRLLGIAFKLFLQCCLFVIPLSLLILFFRIPLLLGIYPTLISLTLAVTSFAMLLCLSLVRWLGLRKAQSSAQFLRYAFLIVFFLVLFQINRLSNAVAPHEIMMPFWLWRLFDHWGLLDTSSWIWFPVRAVFFDPSSLFFTILAGLGLFGGVVLTMHQPFVQGFQQAISYNSQNQQYSRNKSYSTSFHNTLLLKEWRLMWREENFALEVLLLTFYFAIAILVVQQGAYFDYLGDSSAKLIPVATVISGTLVNKFIHFCISKEEAPDLLKASPFNGLSLRKFKILAALVPTYFLLVPISIVLMMNKVDFLDLLTMVLGIALYSVVLGFWSAHPVITNDPFKVRKVRQKDFLFRVLELILLFVWAAISYTISQGKLDWTCVCITVALLIVIVFYLRSRQIGTSTQLL